jgi:hypothetical protein
VVNLKPETLKSLYCSLIYIWNEPKNLKLLVSVFYPQCSTLKAIFRETVEQTIIMTQVKFGCLTHCSIYSNRNHIGHVAGSSGTALKIDPLRMFQPNFGSNSPSSFKREDKNVYIQGQTTDTK